MLKGTTKIELTNVHTREKQVVQKHNMITNAISEIFQPTLGHLSVESTLRGYVPAYSTLLGGLLLFDSALDANANKYFAPAGVNITGCARYNEVNTSTSKIRGSYNMTESKWDAANKKMTYVYDFNTSQGNGTIASVCLTHLDAGYGTYGSDLQYSTPVAKNCYSTPKQYTVGGKDQYSGISVGNYEHLFLLDPDNDCAYYLKVTDATHLAITKRRMGLKNISLFTNDLVLLESTDLPELTTALASYKHYCFDPDDDALYIFAAANSTTAVNQSFTVTKVVFGSWATTQYTITNTGDATLNTNGRYAFVHRGYVYVRSYNSNYYVYKIQLTNTANIVKLDGNGSTYSIMPVLALNGYVYWQYYYSSSSTSCRMNLADSELNKLKFSGNGYLCSLYNSSNYTTPSFTVIRNHPMLYYISTGSYSTSYFYFLGNYLATINNLTEAVVKTADKTMKITYIIEEV